MARDTAWVAVRVTAAPEQHQQISEALFELGAGGVQEEKGVLITHFPPGHSEIEIRDAVSAAAPAATVEVGESPDVDWSEAFKHGINAHRLGALTVTPPWLAEGRHPATTVIIEPAAGFGTGEHPTTRSVIRLMQEVLRPGDVVADLGSGSGILAIAAAKLGASRVIAIEMDDDSNQNAAENIEMNGVGDVVTLLPGDATLLLPLVAPVDVIVANIISSVLLPLTPVMRSALRVGAPGSTELTQDAGRRTQEVSGSTAHTDSTQTTQHAERSTQRSSVILAGILVSEREMMLRELSSEWLVVSEDVEGDWWSVLLTPCHPASAPLCGAMSGSARPS